MLKFVNHHRMLLILSEVTEDVNTATGQYYKKGSPSSSFFFSTRNKRKWRKGMRKNQKIFRIFRTFRIKKISMGSLTTDCVFFNTNFDHKNFS